MRALLLLLLLLGGLAWAAFTYLPWWAMAGGSVLLLGLGKWSGGKLLTAALKAPFRAKGAVLHGAFVHVHSVLPARAPQRAEPAGQDAADAPGLRHLCMEVTISPQVQGDGPFQLWCPGELQLVGPEAQAEDTEHDGEDCEITAVEVADDAGRFRADEGLKYNGAQRLRLRLAVQPAVRRLQFRYYFDLLGSVALPE